MNYPKPTTLKIFADKTIQPKNMQSNLFHAISPNVFSEDRYIFVSLPWQLVPFQDQHIYSR